MIQIDDARDARIEAYRCIRERDLRGRDGLAIAEGSVVLAALLRSTLFEPISLLLLRNRVDGLTELLETVPSDVPIYVAEREVLDEIAGFPMHRGILATAKETLPRTSERVLTMPAQRIVVAIGTANHDNSGAILRVASAFGAAGVLFDRTSVDPLYRKSIRVSAGSAFTLPHAREGSGLELLDLVAAAGYRPLALSPNGERPIGEVGTDQRIAIVLGPEGPGLPDEVLDRCATARIPMAKGHDSLNVAVSAAVALHALSR